MGQYQEKTIQKVEEQYQIHPIVRQEAAAKKELNRVIVKEARVIVYQEVSLKIMTALINIGNKGKDQMRKEEFQEDRKQDTAKQVTVKASQITGRDIQHPPIQVPE